MRGQLPIHRLVCVGRRAVLLLLLLVLLAACADMPQPVPPTPVATLAGPTNTPPQQLPAPGTTALPEMEPPPTSTPVSGVGDETPALEPPQQGEPNRIVVPAIGLDAPIVDVGWQVVQRGSERLTEWETADNAAGRHINSARPGEQGNVVLSGHHNTRGEVFRRISELELQLGDRIYLYDAQGRRFTYVVEEVTDPPLLEVGATAQQRLQNARYILPTDDARVTLVTCWPYWTNTHRIVVVGTLEESP